MEDLFPLVIFLLVVGANVFKFFAAKGKAKPPPADGRPQPRRKPSALESLFEELAEQMAPKPTELAEWPEGFERPDYAHEMEAFQRAPVEEFKEAQPAEIMPFSAPEPSQPAPIQNHAMQRAGKTHLLLKGKKNLKQAMLAHIVFSPPRAYDLSFKNTLVK